MSIVCCVGSPDGTMSQIIRGFSSFCDELLQRGGRRRAVAGGRLQRVRVEVEGDDVMVRVAPDAMDHVAAHLAEADEAELHGI